MFGAQNRQNSDKTTNLAAINGTWTNWSYTTFNCRKFHGFLLPIEKVFFNKVTFFNCENCFLST